MEDTKRGRQQRVSGSQKLSEMKKRKRKREKERDTHTQREREIRRE